MFGVGGGISFGLHIFIPDASLFIRLLENLVLDLSRDM